MSAGDSSNISTISATVPAGRVAFSVSTPDAAHAHAIAAAAASRASSSQVREANSPRVYDDGDEYDGEVIDSPNEEQEQEKQQNKEQQASIEQDEKLLLSSGDDVISDPDQLEKQQLEQLNDENGDELGNINDSPEDVDEQPLASNYTEEAATPMLSPRQGVSFREEFDRLPDFSPTRQPRRSASPAPPMGYFISPGVATPVLTLLGRPEDLAATAPFYNVTLNDFVGRDVPLLIGELPVSEPDYAVFWSAVNRLNVCGVVTVNLAHEDKGTEMNVGSSLPWPTTTGTEVVYARKLCARTIQIESFRSFQSSIVKVQDLDFGCDREIATWSFVGWPTSGGHSAVPSLPLFYLDFLRAVIQQSYFSCRTGQPLLIVDRNGLDIAGLTAAVVMLLYQACGQRRADVWRCVADLRGACRRNIVSRFSMYEFIYDCLLQVMCATPTIMSGNFRRAFRHLLRRGPPLIGPAYSPRSDSSSLRRVAPIIEQFELIGSLSAMYRSRIIGRNLSLSPRSISSAGGKRGQFEPRNYKGIRYFNMPSFTNAKHFLVVRGVVHINVLLELMAKRCSRTLLWFSETPRADEILTGNQRDGVVIGEVSAYGVFYSYEMEAPTSRGPWRVTVVQFVGWPAFCGERPARPCRELIVTLRRAIEHADAVAASFTPSLPTGEPPLQPVVTIFEAEAGSTTWRGAMAALVATLDQRMARFLEVDVFRTAQIFKMFDPESILISPKQYIWCFKTAWSSYLLSTEGKPNQLEAGEQNTNKQTSMAATLAARNEESDELVAEGCYNNNNPYGSEKYLYSYPNMAADGEQHQLVTDEALERPIVPVHHRELLLQQNGNYAPAAEGGRRHNKHSSKRRHGQLRQSHQMNNNNNVMQVSS